MAILEKEVWIGLRGNNISHYESLGYAVPRSINKYGKLTVPQGVKILVKIEDLTTSSPTKVTKVCDYCGEKTPNQTYQNVIRNRKLTKGEDRCAGCGRKKASESQKNNVEYEKSLEHFAITNNRRYLLTEFSNKNTKTPDKVSRGSKHVYLWNCQNCKSEYEMCLDKRTTRDDGCPYCSGKRVNQTNCLWTTHPHIAQLLKNPHRGYEVTKGTAKKEEFVCNKCGYTNIKVIGETTLKGFSCSKCSDGLKYPEKFLMNVLDQLNISYEKEMYFEWSKNICHKNKKLSGDKRYDFYIPSLNCLIETHGKQHYEEGFGHIDGARNLVEEQENDKLKEALAINNKIKSYVTIDCRISELDFIKNNIISSELNEIFNLNNIDWLKCHEYAVNSLVKLTCDLWKNGATNTIEISKVLKLSRNTVIKYLKQGTDIGWCDYNSQEEMRKSGYTNGKNKGKKLVQFTLSGELIKQWESAVEVRRITGINSGNISSACNGTYKTAGGFKWMYKEDYDQYIKQAK